MKSHTALDADYVSVVEEKPNCMQNIVFHGPLLARHTLQFGLSAIAELLTPLFGVSE